MKTEKNKKFIQKLTPHNIFIKWPRIFIYEKFREKSRNSFLRNLFFPNSPLVLTDKHGIRFVWYPWDKTSIEKLLSHRMFDEDYIVLRKFIKEDDMVFDIGANIGLHSRMFSLWTGKKGIVHSFEPVPETYDILCETLALNRAHNVRPHNLAFLDKPGTISMNVFDHNNSALNSFGNPAFGNVAPIGKVEVEADTLDNFCAAHGISKINFLKVDVEGFEKSVFKGAQKMLGEGHVDYLSFEISKIPLEGSGTKPKEIFDILSSYGYKSYRYNFEKEAFEGPFHDSSAFYENYYASRHDLTVFKETAKNLK